MTKQSEQSQQSQANRPLLACGLFACFLAAAFVTLGSAPLLAEQFEGKAGGGVGNMARGADAIVIGRVETKETVFEDGVIQTRYSIKVSQYLKGEALGSSIQITQAGGSITDPMPLRQKVGGHVHFFRDEKLLLFLDLSNASEEKRQSRERFESNREEILARQARGEAVTPVPKALPWGSPLMSTPMILGSWRGHYTIVKDDDGKEVAFRLRSDINGIEANKENLTALRSLVTGAKAGSAKKSSDSEDGLFEFLAPAADGSSAMSLEDLKMEIRHHVELQKADGLKQIPRKPGDVIVLD